MSVKKKKTTQKTEQPQLLFAHFGRLKKKKKICLKHGTWFPSVYFLCSLFIHNHSVLAKCRRQKAKKRSSVLCNRPPSDIPLACFHNRASPTSSFTFFLLFRHVNATWPLMTVPLEKLQLFGTSTATDYSDNLAQTHNATQRAPGKHP